MCSVSHGVVAVWCMWYRVLQGAAAVRMHNQIEVTWKEKADHNISIHGYKMNTYTNTDTDRQTHKNLCVCV